MKNKNEPSSKWVGGGGDGVDIPTFETSIFESRSKTYRYLSLTQFTYSMLAFDHLIVFLIS